MVRQQIAKLAIIFKLIHIHYLLDSGWGLWEGGE